MTRERWGLLGVVLALFLCLTLALPILDAEAPRRRVMGLFYLSLPLTLLLAYLFAAVGRLRGLGVCADAGGLAARLQAWGFPLGHRHAWGDAGRLYALLFLCFVGGVILSGFCTLIASAVVGFEGRIAIDADGAGALSEPEAMAQIAEGTLALTSADAARRAQVLWVRDISFVLGLALLLPCFARLVPFFFWRCQAAGSVSFAKAWRQVPWRYAFLYGVALLAILLSVVSLPGPLVVRYGLFSLLMMFWAFSYAGRISPFDADTNL